MTKPTTVVERITWWLRPGINPEPRHDMEYWTERLQPDPDPLEPYRQAGRDLAIGIRAIVDAMVEALGPIVAVVQAAAEELGRP